MIILVALSILYAMLKISLMSEKKINMNITPNIFQMVNIFRQNGGLLHLI